MGPKSSGGRGRSKNPLPPKLPWLGSDNGLAEEDVEKALQVLRSATDETAHSLNFSDRFLEQFFSFFELGSQRIKLQTQSCEDIRAILSLVKEKQADLELVSLMAKKVYDENLKLRFSNEQLEASRKAREDEITQLKQEVAKKNSILGILSRDQSQDDALDSQEAEVVACWEDIKDECNDDVTYVSAEELNQQVFKKLQEKVSLLEEENRELRKSTDRCFAETEKLESWEKGLYEDLFSLLEHTQNEVKQLQEDFSSKKSALQKTQAEKGKILSELVDLHRNYNKLSSEYDSLLDAVDDASSGPSEHLSFKINEILMRFSKRSESGHYWHHDNRRQPNRNNKYQSKDRNHNRSHTQSFNQSNWPKKEFVNSSYFGQPIEFEQRDRANVWGKNERFNDSESEKVQSNEGGSNNPWNPISGNSSVLQKSGSTILPEPISFNNKEVTNHDSKGCTYAQVASKPPSRAPSMDDLTNIPGTGTLTTPQNSDSVMTSKCPGAALSGPISDWMSAGCGRTWRRRKQNQENYFSGHPGPESRGATPGFGGPNGDSFGRGRMKRFNSNMSLNAGSDNSWFSNESNHGSKNEDQSNQNRASGRRRVDSHSEMYCDNFSTNNTNKGSTFMNSDSNKNENGYNNYKQTSTGQLKRNRYGSMYNLNSYN